MTGAPQPQPQPQPQSAKKAREAKEAEAWSDEVMVKSTTAQFANPRPDTSSYWYEKLSQGAVFSDEYGFGFFPKEAPSSFPKTLAPAADPDENWHIPIRRRPKFAGPVTR